MYAAALIDSHPLLRLGLARILSGINSIHEVRSYDPAEIDAERIRSTSGMPVQILLFGQSENREGDQNLLQRMVDLIDPQEILILSEGLAGGGPVHERIRGRIRKTANAEVIEAAVRLIIAGGSCFPANSAPGINPQTRDVSENAAVKAVAVRDASKGKGDPNIMAASARDLRITPRQFEILLLRAQGLSLKETARILGISEATVKAHASAMYRRLNVSNQLEAVKLAMEQGIDLTEVMRLPPH